MLPKQPFNKKNKNRGKGKKKPNQQRDNTTNGNGRAKEADVPHVTLKIVEQNNTATENREVIQQSNEVAQIDPLKEICDKNGVTVTVDSPKNKENMNLANVDDEAKVEPDNGEVVKTENTENTKMVIKILKNESATPFPPIPPIPDLMSVKSPVFNVNAAEFHPQTIKSTPNNIPFDARVNEAGNEKEELVEIPTELITVDWLKREELFNFKQSQSVSEFDAKFTGFLDAIDPEFRHLTKVGCCETYDKIGVEQLFEKLEREYLVNTWPFSNPDFKTSDVEMKEVLIKLAAEVKFCFHIECMKYGYSYNSYNTNLTKKELSSVWIDEIDTANELNTLKAILEEVKEFMKSKSIEYESFNSVKECSSIFDTVLPALYKFENDILAENGVSDPLASIDGRKEYGFDVTEEMVDNMLASCTADKEYGDFTAAASKCIDIFTTKKQLLIIFDNLSIMSSIMDIRIKLSAIRVIHHILEHLPEQEFENLLSELEGKNTLSFNKFFGFDPISWEPVLQDGRPKMMKAFYSSLGYDSPKQDTAMTVNDFKVLKCFYLIFPPNEVNMFIFKIISVFTPKAESEINWDYKKDRENIKNVVKSFPDSLKKRLGIFDDIAVDPTSADSFQFAIKELVTAQSAKPSDRSFYNLISDFLMGFGKIVHHEKIFRIFMKYVENSEFLKISREVMELMAKPFVQRWSYTTGFIEDVIILALTKYSVPGIDTNLKKYEFVKNMLNSCDEIVKFKKMKLDKDSLAKRWKELGHPWFVELYLSEKFTVLSKLPHLEQISRWNSIDVWEDEEKDSAESKVRKFTGLARIPTAWPDAEFDELCVTITKNQVDESVDLIALYKGMLEYAKTFELEATWKSRLLSSIKRRTVPPKVVSFIPVLTIEDLAPSPESERQDESVDDTIKSMDAEPIGNNETLGMDASEENDGEGLKEKMKETEELEIVKTEDLSENNKNEEVEEKKDVGNEDVADEERVTVDVLEAEKQAETQPEDNTLPTIEDTSSDVIVVQGDNEVPNGTPADLPDPKQIPAPKETSARVGTAAPEETPSPKDTPVPKDAPAPEETAAPQETPISEETPPPVETPVPKETSAPEETPVPKETPAPKDTPATEETSIPEETPAQKETPALVETPTLEATSTPDQVVVPASDQLYTQSDNPTPDKSTTSVEVTATKEIPPSLEILVAEGTNDDNSNPDGYSFIYSNNT